MSSIALESLSGEPLVSLTLPQADGNSSLLTTEADLAARHWRRWLQSSRCHDGKLFRRQSMVDMLCGAALSASTRGSPRYRPLWTDEALHRAARRRRICRSTAVARSCTMTLNGCAAPRRKSIAFVNVSPSRDDLPTDRKPP